MSVEGGEVQDALYRCAGMAQFVGSLTGEPMRPTGVRGTFSYYDRGGDHLALHRDIDACEVAVISCLRDTGGTSTRGGGHLCLYPTRVAEPLSAIRASPARGAVVCPLAVGQTIVLLGGVVPHVVLPIAAGRQRVVSILCYQRACRNE